MLGFHHHSTEINAKFDVLCNFAVMFIAALVFEFLNHERNIFPDSVDIYYCILSSLSTTFVFYGVNKGKEILINKALNKEKDNSG